MRRSYSLLPCFLAFLLTSCASRVPQHPGAHQFELSDAEGAEEVWTSGVGEYAGEISINTRQLKNSEWKLQFYENKTQRYNPPLKILVTDAGCEIGYRVMVEYFPVKKTSNIVYIEPTSAMSDELALRVAWTPNNQFVVEVNDKTIVGQYYKHFSHFSVLNNYGKQNIELNYKENRGGE